MELIILTSGFFIAYLFRNNVISFSTGWWFIYISPYNRIFDYSSGLIAGIIFASLAERMGKKDRLLLFSILEIGVILLGYTYYKSSLFPIDSIRRDMFYVPAILLIIFVFAFQKGILSKILSFKIFVKLGELSFPVFMIHQPCITLTALLLGYNIYGAGEWKHFLVQMLLFGAILCVSEVINRFYEIPLKVWFKKLPINNRPGEVGIGITSKKR